MTWFIAYILTIVAANWAITTFGLVPVGFGLMAPAGVYFAGLAFTLRDLTQEALGRRGAVGAILIGAGLSAMFGGPLARASGAAFLLSEFADFAVYTPLRRRRWLVAVALSNLVGLVVDSVLFLWLAFGSLDFLAGQIVGKTWMTLLAVLLLWGGRILLANPRPDLGIMFQPGMAQDSKAFRFRTFACDNGRFASPDTWDAGDWLEWLAGLRRDRERCLFAVAPDVLGDAQATLELSAPYLPTIRQLGYRAAYVAQDGFSDALPDPDAFDVLFIGGNDPWKFGESGGYAAARWARAHGKPTHMGRVNSERRHMTMMVSLFDHVDGTFLKHGPDVNWPKLCNWLDLSARQRFMEIA